MLKDKHEVIVLSRNPNWVVGLPTGAQVVEWDGKTTSEWGHLGDGADAVINLAGENIAGEIPFGPRWTKKRKKAILNSRVAAGKAVVAAIAAAQKKPRVLVQASAIDYYGSFAGPELLTEDSQNGTSFLADVCRQWEAATELVERWVSGGLSSALHSCYPWMKAFYPGWSSHFDFLSAENLAAGNSTFPGFIS